MRWIGVGACGLRGTAGVRVEVLHAYGEEDMANVVPFKTNTATVGDNTYQMLPQCYAYRASYGMLTKIPTRRSTATRRHSSLTRSCGMHFWVFATSVCGRRQNEHTVADNSRCQRPNTKHLQDDPRDDDRSCCAFERRILAWGAR